MSLPRHVILCLTFRARTQVNRACEPTEFILAGLITFYAMAFFWPPASDPENSQFLRPKF